MTVESPSSPREKAAVADCRGTPQTIPSLRLASGEPCPIPRAYWVVPGWLMGGAYPGSPNPSETAERPRALARAGVRTFVNLVEASETNNAGVPFAPYEAAATEAAPCVPLSFIRMPIRDLGAPTREAMRGTLDVIDLSLAAGRPVFVHCFGGVGRTATVLGCWLLRHGFAKADGVEALIARLRLADAGAGKRPAPETREQRTFLAGWGG